MKYKLIALDLDGTLKNSDNQITAKTKEALIEVQKQGVKIVLASGRPTAGLRHEAKELLLDKFGGYLLSFNGARVGTVPNQETVYEQTLSIEEAKKTGATALFGEKYGDVVRVVNIGGYSIEFCGGTHLTNSAYCGTFKLVSESGVAAGVRRIEALTGAGALEFYDEIEFTLKNIADTLKTAPADLIKRVAHLMEENKKLAKEVESLKAKMSGGLVDDIVAVKVNIKGVDVAAAQVKGLDMNALRTMGDQIKDKLDGIIVLASGEGNKCSFVVMCSDNAVKAGANAGQIVKAAAAVCGGGGGGRPNMAQAGGKDASKISEALEAAKTTIEGLIK